MIICHISEDKIRKCFSKGIKSLQILRYLNKNVHPKVILRKKEELKNMKQNQINKQFLYLPENVTTQINIWSEAQK